MYWLSALSVASVLGVVAAVTVVDRDRTVTAIGTVIFAGTLPVLVGTASASAAGQVGSIACRIGVGDLVTFAIAAIGIFHVVKGAYTATLAFNKLGSTRVDRQREGRRAMIGALRATAGVFFPVVVSAIFTVVLEFDLGACIHLV